MPQPVCLQRKKRTSNRMAGLAGNCCFYNMKAAGPASFPLLTPAREEFALVSDEIVSDLDSLIAMFLTDTFEFDYIVYEGDELAALLGSGS